MKNKLIALGMVLLASVATAAEKPDILFIAIDDMNDWTTLFDDANPIQTPNLKRLAARGAFFTKAYCAAPGCNPSRTAILTGQRPSTSGVYGNRDAWKVIIPNVVTLPQYFTQSGYATKGAGKIFHHGATGADREDNPSFQDFYPLQLHANAPPVNYNGYVKGRDARQLASASWDWGEHDAAKQTDEFTVEHVNKVMATHPKEQPLFLAAGIFRPHLPFWAPPETFKRYPFNNVVMPPMPANDLDDVPAIGQKMAHTEYFIWENTTRQPADSPGSLKKMVQSYQASADYADQMVGRLLDQLDATDRAKNTVVVLWADHGYHLGDKEACVKFTLWEKANHVPFIIVAPGVTTPGSIIDRPVSLVDIYPTLIDLAGLPARDGLDGQSLVPLLKNPDADWPRPALMTQLRGNHAVRSDRFRYIHYNDGTEELYDHQTDHWEHNNLATDPRYASIIRRHKQWLPKNEAVTPANSQRSAIKKRAAASASTTTTPPLIRAKPAPTDSPLATPRPVTQKPLPLKPNIVFIFIDDMGYGDIGPFGSTINKTPHLDRMAAEGLKLTQYYVSATACTPSRSALMTGCYADRVGMDGRVVFPGDPRGLNPDEVTIAEMLKEQGYATGCFGKWHLGDQPRFMPLAQGFDEYLGIPYSNDMWSGNKAHPPLPLIKGNQPVAHISDAPNQALLTQVTTDAAVEFIKEHRNEPFFLYVPYASIHGPRFARDEWLDKAEGDVTRAQIEEVDSSAGHILETLRELGLEEDTLVIFTSDNGGSGGTSMGPLRGNKGGQKYEGHMRTPTLAWWPGRIPAGSVTDEIAATIDMLQTFAALTGAHAPSDRVIDGRDVSDLLLQKPGAKSPHELLYYEYMGIRRGPWKLVRLEEKKHEYGYTQTELYNLDEDLGETNNLVDKHPGIASELNGLLSKHVVRVRSHRRPAGTAENPRPFLETTKGMPTLIEYWKAGKK